MNYIEHVAHPSYWWRRMHNGRHDYSSSFSRFDGSEVYRHPRSPGWRGWDATDWGCVLFWGIDNALKARTLGGIMKYSREIEWLKPLSVMTLRPMEGVPASELAYIQRMPIGDVIALIAPDNGTPTAPFVEGRVLALHPVEGVDFRFN